MLIFRRTISGVNLVYTLSNSEYSKSCYYVNACFLILDLQRSLLYEFLKNQTDV